MKSINIILYKLLRVKPLKESINESQQEVITNYENKSK